MSTPIDIANVTSANVNITNDKQVYAFELDNIIYPKQDYDLQVYYLFASFIEFTETFPPQAELIAFSKTAYEQHGAEGMFQRFQDAFGIPEKYGEQLQYLYANAQLPLPLLIYPEMEQLLKELVAAGKQICILTAGNPIEKLNKIKHIQWNGLQQSLKVYFLDELKFRELEPLSFLSESYEVNSDQIAYYTSKDINGLLVTDNN